MSNYKKTLANVKPGGMVRLGDQVLSTSEGERRYVADFFATQLRRHDFGDYILTELAGDFACALAQHLSAQPSQPSSLDLEAMLAACVPGGDMADPQVIADNIRHWFAVQPSQGGQGDALAMIGANLRSLLKMNNEVSHTDPMAWANMRDEIQHGLKLLDSALAARQPVGEPEIWVSPGQLEELKRRPAGQGSNYLPTRLAGEGNFTQPLYAAPPAQAVELGQPNESGRMLYVDLDGVMADFDGAFPAVFGLDHRSLADDEMWSHINGHPSFFRDLPPMAGAVDFFRSIEHLNPVILTACPKSNYPHVAAQKRAWVREHLSASCLVLPVLGGRHKPLFMHQLGDVLIDDFGKNCEAWSEAGGVAIKHEGDWKITGLALRSIGFMSE